MAAWAKAGYFTMDLQLRRKHEAATKPLALLIRDNNNAMPFISSGSAERPPAAPSTMATSVAKGDDATKRRMVDEEAQARAARLAKQQEVCLR